MGQDRQVPQTLTIVQYIKRPPVRRRIEGRFFVARSLLVGRKANFEHPDLNPGSFPGQFTLSYLEKATPGVSHDMLRKILKNLEKEGQIQCIGRGRGAPRRKRVIRLKEGNKDVP